MLLLRLSPLVLIPAAGSCVVVADSGFAATLNTVGYDTVDADATAPGLGLDGSADVHGVGLDLVLRGCSSDFIFGIEDREFDDVDSFEYSAAMRYHIDEGRITPYTVGKVRYSDGLELPGEDSESYVGWGLGLGALFWGTENVYIDLSLLYEDLFQDADTSGGDIDLEGWVGRIGIGIAF